MAHNEKNIILDGYSKPLYDPALQTQVAISEGYNYLDVPSNLDRIQVDLIDNENTTITSNTAHIDDIPGITYTAGRLQVDTFAILTQMFGRTSGRYSIKISGYRNYVYNDIEDTEGDETDEFLNYWDVAPSAIESAGLEIIELSKSKNEIRLKASPRSDASLQDFLYHETPSTIPFSGRYWKYADSNAIPGDPIYYSSDYAYNKDTAVELLTDNDYDAHRQELGLPYGDNNEDRWNGVRKVDSSLNRVGWVKETAGGRRLESTNDIWPVQLRIIKPNGSIVELISTNWIDNRYTPKVKGGEEEMDAEETVIFKLAQPAPASLRSGVRAQVIRPLFVPYVIPVEINIPVLLDEMFDQLRGPNLRLDINRNSSKSTTLKNELDLVGTTSGIQNRIEKSALSGSLTIKQNIDFRQYKNFVHFSSAEERLKNFRYKLTRVEHYASKSSAVGDGFVGSDGSVTGSQTAIANKLQYDNLSKGIIGSFNPYEQYLYYTSHSTETIYGPDGVETLPPATWPKSTSTQTGIGYNLYSVTSSEAVAWYAGRLTSASTWDQQNQSALRSAVPTHIRVDSSNDSYILFMDMIGEHFDDLYLQIKALEESHGRDESVDVGLSKDLLFDTAKSFGWNLYPGHSTADLWEYVLGTSSEGVYQTSGSGMDHTFVVRESHSAEDIEKQTWKRLLNNLPLLLKTRGTARGIRALLSAYGIPLTILNIDEYGGAPTARSHDTHAIERFNYAINMSGSSTIKVPFRAFKGTTANPDGTFQSEGLYSTADSRTTSATYLAMPKMFEVRIDTTTTQSMYIARTNVAPGVLPHWHVRLEHSSSYAGWDSPHAIAAGSASAYAKYGRLVFHISNSTAGKPAIEAKTDYAPFFDNDWWNISFGVSEQTQFYGSTGTATQSFSVRYAKAAEHSNGRITHSGSATVTGDHTGYDLAWYKGKGSAIFGYNGDDAPLAGNNHVAPYESYSGSLQEIRIWAENLSDTAFYQHTLAPTSVVGDTVTMAYNDLFIRLPLGTDNKTYTLGGVLQTNITGSVPNMDNLRYGYTATAHASSVGGLGGLFRDFTGIGGMADNIPFSPKSETYFVKVPHTAGPSKHSNKVRIEDNTLRNNQLARTVSFEQSSFDSNPVDSEDVSVVLSPADQIDLDIAMQFGGFDLDDYIGDPRDKHLHEYTSLRDTKNKYFKKYTQGNSVLAFVRYLRSFNKGLFKQIEDMIPARADAIVGIEIRPNILERHKLNQPISASQETMHHTSNIIIRSGSDLGGDVPSTQKFGPTTHGTLTTTIGIGAPPSRQRSGSNDYFDLYEGSKYLKNVFGETTESAQQMVVTQAHPANTALAATRLQIPTHNQYNKPVHGVSNISSQGTGWVTVFEDNCENIANNMSPTIGANDIISPSDRRDSWRIVEGSLANIIDKPAGGGTQFGDNSGNDMVWLQWDNPLPFEPNTIYRMSATVSMSANAGGASSNKMYCGFSMFLPHAGSVNSETLANVSPTSGNLGYSSAGYFTEFQLQLETNHGIGVDVNLQGYATSIQHSGQAYYNNSSLYKSINGAPAQLGEALTKGPYNGKRFTHFSPMILANYQNDTGMVRITSMKVEALPGGYIDISPNYDSSPALQRLLIDGTRMTSPDWNVGSTQTIDGGPVAEFQLVNPNIVQVATGPGSATPLRGPGGGAIVGPVGGTAANQIQTVQNGNINVR